MIKEESFGVIPLIFQENEWKVFLVFHRVGGYWGFPKGHPLDLELPMETAIRELQEETGLHVKEFLKYSPFLDHYQFEKHGQFIDKTACYFPALVFGNVGLQKEEIQEGKWVKLNEASSVLSFKQSQQFAADLSHILLI